ncbi:DNA-directed DNA polymerase, family A domain protein, partial [mine drainage metagenome]
MILQKGHKSTNKQSLERLTGEVEQSFIKLLFSYRKAAKKKGTYIDPLLASLDQTGILHPQYTIARTATYRISSENPNIQNFPRERNIRNTIRAPEGQRFVSAD